MEGYKYTEKEKKLFEELSSEGFVLDHRYALKYLRYACETAIEQGFDNEQDSETVSSIIEDLIDMARRIIEEDLEYIRFSECPMSASGMNIAPMIEKGE